MIYIGLAIVIILLGVLLKLAIDIYDNMTNEEKDEIINLIKK